MKNDLYLEQKYDDNVEYNNDPLEKEDIQRKEKNTWKNTFQSKKEMDLKEKGKSIKLTSNRKKETASKKKDAEKKTQMIKKS